MDAASARNLNAYKQAAFSFNVAVFTEYEIKLINFRFQSKVYERLLYRGTDTFGAVTKISTLYSHRSVNRRNIEEPGRMESNVNLE